MLDCPESAQKGPMLRLAWGEWIANLRPWEWFVTLTFKPPKQGIYDRRGIAYTKRAVQRFTDEVSYHAPTPCLVDGVWAIERHVSEAPHVHGLMTATTSWRSLGRRMDMVDWAWEHTGMARVEAVEELGAPFYVSKYIMQGGPECLILNVQKPG